MTPLSLQPVAKRGFLRCSASNPIILIEFQFNPTQISDKRAVTYGVLNAPGMLMPVRQYIQGSDRTLSFTVTVEGMTDGPVAIARADDGSIGPELNKYRALLYPQADGWQTATGTFVPLYQQFQQFVAPPTCQFGFGDTVIDCIVTDVGITEKLFNQDLRPLRAEVSVSLVEVVLYENMPTPPPKS
jgi:hypothetical protein